MLLKLFEPAAERFFDGSEGITPESDANRRKVHRRDPYERLGDLTAAADCRRETLFVLIPPRSGDARVGLGVFTEIGAPPEKLRAPPPGSTIVMWMPSGATSRARDSKNPSMPHFVA